MNRTFSNFALALLACAAAQAATLPTTLTVNATATANSTFTAFALTGTANFTGGIGNGTITSSISLASLTGATASADYTITLAAGGTITGKLSVPTSVLSGGTGSSVSVSLTVTGGTGTYAGATNGTTPFTLSGAVTGDLFNGLKFTNFTGSGTLFTGGTTPPPVPSITAVQDAASNTPNIAQGSIFIVKGTNLSAAGYTPFAPPRPTVSSGVKVTFTPATGGGAGTDAYLVYLYNQGGVNQIACILPSTVAVGNYNVTVTNGTVSAPVATQVVANKVALFTQDSSGAGMASVQNYISASVVDLNRLTTGSLGGVSISPAKPGQPVIAYGTGLGAYAAGDNSASPVFDFRSTLDIKAVVGGVTIPVDYAGRAGYAGEDQINFTLPASIPTGCAVTLQISVGGKLSAPTSIAIAPSPSADACVIPGFTTQQLQNFDKGGTYTIGAFYLEQFSENVPPLGDIKVSALAGAFYQFTGFQISGAATTLGQVTPTEGCQVSHTTYTTGPTTTPPPPPTPTPTPTVTITGLDAGSITLTGPAASNINALALKQEPTTNTYSASLSDIPIPGQPPSNISVVPGTYSLKGAGGKGVGPFTASVSLGLSLNGGLPTNVVRSSGLTLNWTGGNATDVVEIIGSASTTSGTSPNLTIDTAGFVCTTAANKGTFTVPASVLTQLPAVPAATSGTIPTSYGYLSIYSTVNPSSGNGLFTAPLTAGGNIDYGYFLGFFGSSGTVTYQ